MVVMTPREKWTDERLEDLSKKVDDGFARVDSDIRELRVEVKHQGASLRAEMSAGFQRVEMNLEKKIEGTRADLEKKIDGNTAALDEDIRELRSGINRAIYGAVAAIILAQIANSAIF
jgi:hypothetical protein